MSSLEDRWGLTVFLEKVNEAQKELAAAKKKLKDFHEAYEFQLDEQIKKLTDEEILADQEILEYFLKHETYYIYQRAGNIVDPGIKGLRLSGGELRKEFYGLPVLELWLSYEQDPSPIAESIRAWSDKFALGRTDLNIEVMTYDCGESGFWTLNWVIETDVASVEFTQYSHTDYEFAGHLVEALDYLAKHAWYQGGPREDGDYDD